MAWRRRLVPDWRPAIVYVLAVSIEAAHPNWPTKRALGTGETSGRLLEPTQLVSLGVPRLRGIVRVLIGFVRRSGFVRGGKLPNRAAAVKTDIMPAITHRESK